MKTVGYPISKKENEKRRALLLDDISSIHNKSFIFVESGYGKDFGYTDQDYLQLGVNVCDRMSVLSKDIICDPKIGDAEYLNDLYGQTLFGWIHAVQNRDITDKLVKNKLTAYAWEDMNNFGRHVFYRNNEIAGEAAIMHAYTLHGLFPNNTKVALIGRGNIARGALKILNYFGADVTVYERKTEYLFRKEFPKYDVIINAVLWDITRTDHLLYEEDLKKMKNGSMIIDISCDKNGGIETSRPTTINNPIYFIDGVCHYVVDHTPALFYKTVSFHISKIVSEIIDDLIEDNKQNTILKCSNICNNGTIIDKKIIQFQKKFYGNMLVNI